MITIWGATDPIIGYYPTYNNSGAAGQMLPGIFLSNVQVSSSAEDYALIYANDQTGFTQKARVVVNNMTINRTPGTAYAKSLISEISSGNITFDLAHVKINDNASAAAQFITYQSNIGHAISFCDASGGWTANIGSATRFIGNSGFLQGNQMPGARTGVIDLVANQTENLILSETGANNAIAGQVLDAGSVQIPVTTGFKATFILAHSLQAGANTVSINGVTAPLKSSRNYTATITTAYAANGVISVLYNGTNYLDLSQ